MKSNKKVHVIKLIF